MNASAAVAGTCFHTRMATPRTAISAVSNAAPGAVRRACASSSDNAGQLLGLSFMAGVSITKTMTTLSGFSDPGFSDERLARIPRFLQNAVEAGALPGALTLIWRRGRVAHRSMVGMVDLRRAAPMREDAIFRLYSMTKPITAVALLMLMEEGRIALDDPVAHFIPGFANLKLQD